MGIIPRTHPESGGSHKYLGEPSRLALGLRWAGTELAGHFFLAHLCGEIAHNFGLQNLAMALAGLAVAPGCHSWLVGTRNIPGLWCTISLPATKTHEAQSYKKVLFYLAK